MSPLDLIILLALTGWAVYKQTRIATVNPGLGRFTMAALYAGIGLAVGGFSRPSSAAGLAMIIISLLLSLVIGIFRGRLTRIWTDADGRLVRQGTALTVGLFLGLIATKFALGALAQIWHINDGAGLGEVLVMIAIMIAVQAEIIHRRAARVRPVAAPADPDTVESQH